jgi:acetyl-CoA carboxylase biotin carboxyl carrier protein
MATTPKSTSTKRSAAKTTPSDETKLVQDLADILDKAGLAELEYESETVAIRLSRVVGAAPVAAVQPAPAAITAQPSASAASTPAATETKDHPGAVTSPMVGTVYTAPEPGSPDFVSEGDTVKVGQTLFIVEAMKVMNPITAPAAGTVVQVLVQNAQPVEFGQALVIVE